MNNTVTNVMVPAPTNMSGTVTITETEYPESYTSIPEASPHNGSMNAIVGGVTVAVVLVLIGLAVVLLRYICRHKGSYFTNEAKGTEHAQTADAALKGDPSLQQAADESKKEYFI